MNRPQEQTPVQQESTTGQPGPAAAPAKQSRKLGAGSTNPIDHIFQFHKVLCEQESLAQMRAEGLVSSHACKPANCSTSDSVTRCAQLNGASMPARCNVARSCYESRASKAPGTLLLA